MKIRKKTHVLVNQTKKLVFNDYTCLLLFSISSVVNVSVIALIYSVGIPTNSVALQNIILRLRDFLIAIYRKLDVWMK